MGSYCLIGIKFQFYKMKKVIGMHNVNVLNTTDHLTNGKDGNFMLCILYYNIEMFPVI